MSASSETMNLTSNRSGWVWAGLCALVGAAAAVDCFVRGFGGLGLTVLVWTALVVWFVALVFVLPRLSIDDTGATVRNVLVSVRVPWGQLQDARSTMFVELIPRQGEPVRVWAAPQSAMRRGRASLRAKANSDVEVGTGPASKSDLAGGLLVERDRALGSGRPAASLGGAVTRTFLTRDWAIFGALAVVAVVSLLFV